jgi:general secretion pathway protein G
LATKGVAGRSVARRRAQRIEAFEQLSRERQKAALTQGARASANIGRRRRGFGMQARKISSESVSFPRRARKRRRAGFTLVEMLVVLAIIGSIVGLVGPRVLNYLAESKVKTAQIQMANLSSALELFYLDAGRYPATEEGLGALVQRPANAAAWNGPYLKTGGLPKDPWGHDYLYRAPGQNGPFDIGSLGPEGREGGPGALSRSGNGGR